jgi:hypothetical protein
MTMKTTIGLCLALVATTAAANPAVDSWPWQDTTVTEPYYGGNSRWCSRVLPSGEEVTPIMKPRESYALFQCSLFTDYTRNPSTPVPHCGPAFTSYYCSMQDCKNYAGHKEKSGGYESYHWVLTCAVQDEPGGVWHFDDSPND